MRRVQIFGRAVLVLIALGVLGWGSPLAWAGGGAGPTRIVVSIQPLAGLIRPLLKGVPAEGWTLDVLVPPGVSEHGYELPPSVMGKLGRAEVVFLVGLGLEPAEEQFLREHARAGRRVMRLADLAKVGAGKEKEGGEAALPDEDEGSGADPHIWLDPGAVERALPGIAGELKGVFPEWAAAIGANEQEMVKKVRAVDAAYAERLKSAPTRTLVVGHDAWGYLARRYKLKVVAIKGLNAEEGTPASMARAVRAIREQSHGEGGARAVCVEPQFAAAGGRRVAEQTGVPVLTLDPLGNGDWFGMMETNLEVIARALGVKG